MNCYNCAMPPGTLASQGRDVKIVVRAENNFKRDHKVTVWCCSDECAIQTAYQARYGRATHRAPISLNQFRSEWRIENAG